jgi:hypothetical protein
MGALMIFAGAPNSHLCEVCQEENVQILGAVSNAVGLRAAGSCVNYRVVMRRELRVGCYEKRARALVGGANRKAGEGGGLRGLAVEVVGGRGRQDAASG